MSIFEAIVLGVVQGLTEFLPISSSGHLRVVPAIAGWDDPGASFTAVIQLGTMAAVVIFFWKDLVRVAGAWLRSLVDKDLRRTHDALMGWYLIVATVPIAIIGFVFRDQIRSGARDLRLIASTLIIGGLVLAVADRMARRTKHIDEIGIRDGVTVGLAQTFALIPGVSRSGATITAGLFLGYTREAAARFSFLLSVPAVVLSGLFSLTDVGGDDAVGLAPTVVATVVSFVVGYAAIAWLLRWVAGHSMLIFVVYRIGLGLLVFALLAAGTVEAR